MPSPSNSQMNELLDSIPNMISSQDNDMLMASFTIQEICKVVFSFSPDKAPSPDGFTAMFYQS